MSRRTVPGFSVSVRRTQVTFTTPRFSSIGRYALSADEAEALANKLRSAAFLAGLAEGRRSLLQAFVRGNYELTAELDGDEWWEAAGAAGGASDRALNEGPIHLSEARRDAALVRVLNETSRILARLAQLVSRDLGTER